MTEPTVNGHVPEAVRADHVEINQGGATSIDAQTVSITQGGAAQVRATDVSISQGGIALARAGKLSLAEGSSALAVVADSAVIDPGARVVFLLARNASGDVRPLVDLPSALAIGAGIGLAITLLRRLG